MLLIYIAFALLFSSLNIMFSYSLFESKEGNQLVVYLNDSYGFINNNFFNYSNYIKNFYYVESFNNVEIVLEIYNGFNTSNLVFEDEDGNILDFCFLFNESCGYCPKPWIEYNGKCYLVGESNNEKSTKNWLNAKQFCEDLNATLVVINNDKEAEFLVYLFNKTTSLSPYPDNWNVQFWVGLFQGVSSAKPNSNWIWLKESSWFKWAENEPNDWPDDIEDNDENCGQLYHPMSPGPFTLNDENCSKNLYFICEREPFYSNKTLVKVNLKKSFLVREGQGLKIGEQNFVNLSLNLNNLENFTLSFWFKGKGVVKLNNNFTLNFNQNLINLTLNNDNLFFYYSNFLVEVYNPNNKELVDFQFLIELPFIPNFNFIILDENNNVLPYCFEQINKECNQTKTNKIWVKLKSIKANSKLKLYFIKTEEDFSSDGFSVFDFYDDFNLLKGWLKQGYGEIRQNCSLFDFCVLEKYGYCEPSGGIKDIGINVTDNFVLEAKLIRLKSYHYDDCPANRFGIINKDGNGYGFHFTHKDLDNIRRLIIDRRDYFAGNIINQGFLTSNRFYDFWYIGRLIKSGNLIKAEFINASSFEVIASVSINDDSFNFFNKVYVFGGKTYFVDWIRIRKYAEKNLVYEIKKINLNNFTHILLTKNNSLIKIYLNGKNVENLSFSNALNLSYFFTNLSFIDEILVFNYSFSNEEVLKCFYEGKCQIENSLAYFSFDPERRNEEIKKIIGNFSFDLGVKYYKVNKIYFYPLYFNAKEGNKIFSAYEDFKLDLSLNITGNNIDNLRVLTENTNKKLQLVNKSGDKNFIYWISDLKDFQLITEFLLENVDTQKIWFGFFEDNTYNLYNTSNGFQIVFEAKDDKVCLVYENKNLSCAYYDFNGGVNYIVEINYYQGFLSLKINNILVLSYFLNKKFKEKIFYIGVKTNSDNRAFLNYLFFSPFSIYETTPSQEQFSIIFRPKSINLKLFNSQFIQTKNYTFLFGNITLNITEIEIPVNFSNCDYKIGIWCFEKMNVTLEETQGDSAGEEGNEFIDVVPFDYNQDNLIDFIQLDLDTCIFCDNNYSDDFMVWVNNKTTLVAKNFYFNLPWEPISRSKIRVKDSFRWILWSNVGNYSSYYSTYLILYLNYHNRTNLSSINPFGSRSLEDLNEANSALLNILDDKILISGIKETKSWGTYYYYRKIKSFNYLNLNLLQEKYIDFYDSSNEVDFRDKLSAVGHFSDQINYVIIYWKDRNGEQDLEIHKLYVQNNGWIEDRDANVNLIKGVESAEVATFYQDYLYLKTAFAFDLDLDNYDELLFIYYNSSNKLAYLNYYDFHDNKLYLINTTDKIVGFNATKIIPVDYNNDGLLDLLFVRNYINDYVLLLNKGANKSINVFYTHWPNKTRFPYFFKSNNTFFYTFTFNDKKNKDLVLNYYSVSNYNLWFNETAFLPIFECNYYDFYYRCKLKGLRLKNSYFVLVGNLTKKENENLALRPIKFFYPWPKAYYCYFLKELGLAISSDILYCGRFFNYNTSVLDVFVYSSIVNSTVSYINVFIKKILNS